MLGPVNVPGLRVGCSVNNRWPEFDIKCHKQMEPFLKRNDENMMPYAMCFVYTYPSTHVNASCTYVSYVFMDR